MPLVAIVRLILAPLSLIIPGLAAYFLWTWQTGLILREVDVSPNETARVIFIRENWRLWTGLALLAWSFGGGFVLKPFLARKDDDPLMPARRAGQMISMVNGAEVYVEMLGKPDAPPIILTHGWGLDSTIWAYAKRDLARNFRVIVWDLPGVGRSKAGAGISLEGFAACLQALVGLTSGRPVVLVGHSIGGMTIQTLARDYPEVIRRNVAGVVLLNTTYTNPLKTMILSRLMQALRRPLIEPLMRLTILLQPVAWISAWQSYLSGSAHLANRIQFGRFVTHSQLNHAALLGTKNPPGSLARGNLAMFDWDATGVLADLAVPMLVIGGDIDIVTKPEASKVIASDAGARMLLVEGVNHMGFLERSGTYNGAIAKFASSVQPATGASPLRGASVR